MRPLVEVSFTPTALASDPAEIQDQLWYNNRSPNISPPTGATTGDWSKWIALMAEFVRHLEDRYGAEEVRKNWYFEVWNEPSWMYSLGTGGYFELYRNTVAGLLQGDPEVRVGGPAGSSGESSSLIRSLITGAFNTGTKLDFITYHRYGDDDMLPVGDVTDAVAFHKTLLHDIDLTVVKNMKFTGEILNDEFGPSWMPERVPRQRGRRQLHRQGDPPARHRRQRAGAGVVRLLGGVGSVRGDPDRYRDGFPAGQLRVAAQGRSGDPGVVRRREAVVQRVPPAAHDGRRAAARHRRDGGRRRGRGRHAERDASALQILVYNHVDGGQADASKSSSVSLTLNNLPFTGRIRVRRTIVDYGHANAYRAWLALGSPSNPTQPQWAMLRDAAELCYYETTAEPTAGAWTTTFPQNIYGVTLFEITPAP